jgi:hypothetical protein
MGFGVQFCYRVFDVGFVVFGTRAAAGTVAVPIAVSAAMYAGQVGWLFVLVFVCCCCGCCIGRWRYLGAEGKECGTVLRDL